MDTCTCICGGQNLVADASKPYATGTEMKVTCKPGYTPGKDDTVRTIIDQINQSIRSIDQIN